MYDDTFLVVTLVTDALEHDGWCSDSFNERKTRHRSRFKIDVSNLPRWFRDKHLDFSDDSVDASHEFWFDLHNITASDKDGRFCDTLVEALDNHVTSDGGLRTQYTGGCHCCDQTDNMTELDYNPYVMRGKRKNCWSSDTTESDEEWM
jgi:hypothetical protein